MKIIDIDRKLKVDIPGNSEQYLVSYFITKRKEKRY
jgi:hypothetical protein